MPYLETVQGILNDGKQFEKTNFLLEYWRNNGYGKIDFR